eukprot:2585097-Pyramimonas_sp.AAC.1
MRGEQAPIASTTTSLFGEPVRRVQPEIAAPPAGVPAAPMAAPAAPDEGPPQPSGRSLVPRKGARRPPPLSRAAS